MSSLRTAAILAVFGAVLLPAAWAPPATAQETARAHYLANEGLMVALGETKVLFDPLFNESFGQYELLPESLREALFAGEPPWDGVDAVFISHYHDDHFSRHGPVPPCARGYSPLRAGTGHGCTARGSRCGR